MKTAGKEAAKVAKAAGKEAAKAAAVKEFVVLDSNGKAFRTFNDVEDAEAFAKHVGGRIAR